MPRANVATCLRRGYAQAARSAVAACTRTSEVASRALGSVTGLAPGALLAVANVVGPVGRTVAPSSRPSLTFDSRVATSAALASTRRWYCRSPYVLARSLTGRTGLVTSSFATAVTPLARTAGTCSRPMAVAVASACTGLYAVATGRALSSVGDAVGSRPTAPTSITTADVTVGSP